MILAAGMGTRLGPLGKKTAKSLVQVAGKPMLAIIIDRLKALGVDSLVINTFHLADQVESYLKNQDFFGLKVDISKEDKLLDTGGSVKRAYRYLRDCDIFILHNCDIYTEFELADLLNFHTLSGSLASLAVQKRETSRYLLFDHKHSLRARAGQSFSQLVSEISDPLVQFGFAGIHVLSQEILEFFMAKEKDKFSIIELYLDLVKEGHSIKGFDIKDSFWIDVGTPENLGRLENYLESKREN